MNLGTSLRARCAVLLLALGAGGQPSHAQAILMSQERYAQPAALPFAHAPAPKPPAPPKPIFILRQDQPIHTEMQAWAKSQDWQLLWQPNISWRVLRNADLSSAANVTEAVAEVIEILREEGKPVRLKISEGNRVMEVLYSKEARE